MSDATAPSAPAEESAASEAYRILRSTLKYATGEAPVRSILVVDVDRREPTNVAARLAQAFARAGDRCVLVETDVRRRSSGPGLSELITGSASADVIQRSDSDAPAIVPPGGAADPDLLAGDGFRRALDMLLKSHDFAVLSAASLPDHADALSIAPHVDAVILIVSAGRTRRARAVDARDALDRVGARMLGVVMVEGKRSLFW